LAGEVPRALRNIIMTLGTFSYHRSIVNWGLEGQQAATSPRTRPELLAPPIETHFRLPSNWPQQRTLAHVGVSRPTYQRSLVCGGAFIPSIMLHSWGSACIDKCRSSTFVAAGSRNSTATTRVRAAFLLGIRNMRGTRRKLAQQRRYRHRATAFRANRIHRGIDERAY
jgi:hypothetical protein